MGCGWLHSADENVLAEIGRDAGFTIDKTPPPWRQSAFNLGLSKLEQAEFGEAFEAFDERIAKAAAKGDDHAASEWFARRRSREPLERADGRHFRRVERRQIRRGLDPRLRRLSRHGRELASQGRLRPPRRRSGQGAPVILDCPVTRIDRSGPTLRVQTPRGAVMCRVVILTVPTSLIGRETIRIDPPAPALVEAALGVPLGLATKLHMTVEAAEDFPADSQLWGRTDTAQTGGYHLRPFGRPMIEGYFGGDLAWGLEREGGRPSSTSPRRTVEPAGLELPQAGGPVATSMWGRGLVARGLFALPARPRRGPGSGSNSRSRTASSSPARRPPSLLRHRPRGVDGGRAGGGRGPGRAGDRSARDRRIRRDMKPPKPASKAKTRPKAKAGAPKRPSIMTGAAIPSWAGRRTRIGSRRSSNGWRGSCRSRRPS